MPRTLAVLLILAAATAACATARAQDGRMQFQRVPAYVPDPSLMSDYVRQLPVGSRVRVTLADGSVLHGILMKGDADPIVVQKRTRVPEAPLQIAIKDVQAVELEAKTSGGKTVAMGAAAGVAAALGVLLILAAVFAGID
jgi:hypothetical protein